jgi:hypothetical protein
MPSEESQSLEPALERAKTTLKTALSEACRADLDRADTGELIHVEEVLAIANEAAKEAISVRRRLHTETPAPAETSSREIEDQRGVRWLVFAVHPSNRSRRAAVNDRFRSGWLSFDCGVETRRLAPIPDNWTELSDGDLNLLCDRAEISPRRRRNDLAD